LHLLLLSKTTSGLCAPFNCKQFLRIQSSHRLSLKSRFQTAGAAVSSSYDPTDRSIAFDIVAAPEKQFR
jgi:hypothetical protein